MNIRELLQKYVNLEFDQLVEVVKEDAFKFFQVMLTLNDDDESEAYRKFMLAISSIVCVDGVVNIKEWKFYNAVFEQDISYDDFNELVKDNNSQSLRNDFDEFVDALGAQVDHKLKVAIVNVMIGFAACNEKITSEEIEYIEQLIK